jgi:oligogalacturonide transport system ATP-binding protein
MAEVIFNKLEKVYSNGFKAVHAIDLKIAEGEFMVIVGPSGCAKSTTLRMLAGLETISGGEVRIGEKIVNNLAPKERGIAMADSGDQSPRNTEPALVMLSTRSRALRV